MFLMLGKSQAGVIFVIEVGLETSVDPVCVLTKPAVCEDCQSAGSMEDSWGSMWTERFPLALCSWLSHWAWPYPYFRATPKPMACFILVEFLFVCVDFSEWQFWNLIVLLGTWQSLRNHFFSGHLFYSLNNNKTLLSIVWYSISDKNATHDVHKDLFSF